MDAGRVEGGTDGQEMMETTAIPMMMAHFNR